MGGTEPRISLSEQVLKAYGVEDNTPIMRAAMERGQGADESDAFSDVVYQDRPVREFAEALGSSLNAIINIGDGGVGKSTTNKSLIRALNRLDDGLDLTGPYAEHVRAFHRRIKQRPRGDIIALWNPFNNKTPIIFRTKRIDHLEPLGERLHEEVYRWAVDLKEEAEELSKQTALYTSAVEELSGIYEGHMVERNDERFFERHWSVESSSRLGPRIVPPARMAGIKQINTQLRASAMRLAKHFPKDDVYKTLEELLAGGPQRLQDSGRYVEDRVAALNTQANALFDTYLGRLRENAKEWEQEEPQIAQWYGQVADALNVKKRRERIVKTIEDHAEVIKLHATNVEPDKKNKVTEGKPSLCLEVTVNGRDYEIESLLAPHTIHHQDSDRLVILEPTVMIPYELFGNTQATTSEDDDAEDDKGAYPIHKQVKVGALGVADLVILDDGIGEFLAEKRIRPAFLTYLQDGIVSVQDNNVQVKLQGGAFIIANETDDPFYRQNFQGQPPSHDGGMAGRFTKIEWDSIVEHSERTASAFPTLLRLTRKQMRDGAQEFTPEAANLLYHWLRCQAEAAEAIPITIRDLKASVFERIFRRAKGAHVTADDVLDFFDDERDHVKQRQLRTLSLYDLPKRTADRKAGRVNTLAVVHDQFGVVSYDTVALTGKLGSLISLDHKAQLTDKSYNKGYMSADMFVQKHFGPFSLEMILRVYEDGTGGNSSAGVETYALMSALGDIPLCQDTYVTGTIIDPDGHIGAIGGVYPKVREVLFFHQAYALRDGREVKPCRALIPRQNVRELLRNALLDRELKRAIDSGRLIVDTHETVWDGFEKMSGMSPAEYTAQIKENIHRIQTRAAEHAYSVRQGMREDIGSTDQAQPTAIMKPR